MPRTMWDLRTILASAGPWALDYSHAEQLRDLCNQPLDQREIVQAAYGEPQRVEELNIVNGVAVINLTGLLLPGHVPYWFPGTSTERVAMQYLSALDAESVREIVVRITSHGGSYHGTAELAELFFKNRGVKPTTAWAVNGQACSAAYVIGAACGRFHATDSSILGSIGVLLAIRETVKQDEKWGEHWELLRRPEMKGAGHPHETLTEERRKGIMATQVDPAYDDMVERIARYRGTTRELVEANYGGGLSLLAPAALEAGMIDAIGDWNDFLSSVAADNSQRTNEPWSPAQTAGQATPTANAGRTEMKWTARMKALLLAAGLVDDVSAADETCATALRAWCAARNDDVPADAQGVIALFQFAPRSPQTPPTPGQVTPPSPQQNGTDFGGGKTNAAELQQAVQAALTAEHNRQAQIRANAGLVGLQETDQVVADAIGNSSVTPDAFAAQALAHLQQQNRPVGRVEAGTAALDTFATAAVDVMTMRAGPTVQNILAQTEGANQQAGDEQLSQIRQSDVYRDVSQLTIYQIAEESVRLAGVRPRDRSPEAVAQAFLQMAGRGETVFARGNPRIDGMMQAGPAHGAGDYPNLMASLANRIVTWSAAAAPVTYNRWGYRLDDMPDFNPRQIIQLSGVREFDKRPDGHEVNQTRFAEDAAWVQRDSYAQGLQLTPRMIVNGLLSEFIRGLVMLQMGHERTINRLCIDLLLDNVTLPIDGNVLFDAAGAHDNEVGNAGPNVAQINLMRTALAQAPAPGDVEEAGLQWAYALYGSNWMNAADVYFDPAFKQAGWGAAADLMTTVNLAAGRVTPLYEPMIGAATAWYAIASSMDILGMVYAFGTGYGPGGQRLTYFKPETKSQHFDFEGSFGAAVVNWQPFVRNPGA